MSKEIYQLPIYRVRARNTSADSENRIHDDAVAANYGFKGALVPGVTVYGYMTVPIVERFSFAWLERGSMQVKFHQPFYEGEEVIVHAEVDTGADPTKVALRAEREDGTVCATALATIDDNSMWLGEPKIEDYPEAPLPPYETRPSAGYDNLVPNIILGTLIEKLDLNEVGASLLNKMQERLPVYYGDGAVAHPAFLLGLSNQILMRNFSLGPWIHIGSDFINRSVARDGEVISVRGHIRDRFERKGHEFVILDLLLTANDNRIVQQVRHTAIYRPRVVL